MKQRVQHATPTVGIAQPTAAEPQCKRKKQAPHHLQGQFVMDRFQTGAGDTVASAGNVDDKETILRLYFLVPLLDAVLCSIKCRFSKQATEFMTCITAFSPENWVNE